MKRLLKFKSDSRLCMSVAAGIVFISILVFSAQTPDKIVKIKTFVSKDGLHAGEVLKAAVSVKIKKYWHIHATELQNELLIPTKLTIEEGDKIEIQKYYFPEPKLEKYDYSESELQIYDDEVIFGALLKTTSDMIPGTYKLQGSLRFQACDDTSCLPPATLRFQIDYKVVSISQETKDINEKIFSQLDFKNKS